MKSRLVGNTFDLVFYVIRITMNEGMFVVIFTLNLQFNVIIFSDII